MTFIVVCRSECSMSMVTLSRIILCWSIPTGVGARMGIDPCGKRCEWTSPALWKPRIWFRFHIPPSLGEMWQKCMFVCLSLLLLSRILCVWYTSIHACNFIQRRPSTHPSIHLNPLFYPSIPLHCTYMYRERERERRAEELSHTQVITPKTRLYIFLNTLQGALKLLSVGWAH